MAETTSVDRGLLIDGGAILAWLGFLMGFVTEVLELHIQVSGAEDVTQMKKSAGGVTEAAGIDEVAHLSVAAGGEADEPLGVGA
jgi:hypothetical protein